MAGAAIFLFLLLPSWLTDRRVRRARKEEAAREGRANQRAGMDEILTELGQISGQLKGELRWGKRGAPLPNTAWTKNRHLVTGEAQVLVENAYEQAHRLDENTIAAGQPELVPRGFDLPCEREVGSCANGGALSASGSTPTSSCSDG